MAILLLMTYKQVFLILQCQVREQTTDIRLYLYIDIRKITWIC